MGVMQSLIGVVVGLLLLGLMMFLHEFGHFEAGRRLGFRILEFNIFMGPILRSWKRRGVQYALRLFPIGASVRFAGEDDAGGAEAVDPKAPDLFYNRPVWRRAVVLLSGPLMNILSGILALLILFSTTSFAYPVLSAVGEDSPAAKAGLEVGDEILRADGRRILSALDWNFVMSYLPAEAEIPLVCRRADGTELETRLRPTVENVWQLGISRNPQDFGPGIRVLGVSPEANDAAPVLREGDLIVRVDGRAATVENLTQALAASGGAALDLEVERGGEMLSLRSKPLAARQVTPLGISFSERHGFLPALGYAGRYYISVLHTTFSSIAMIFNGQIKAKEAISGPVGVVDAIRSVVATDEIHLRDKLLELLHLFAVISISLGIMNLLPIPLLDGSHLWLLILEKIRGRRLSAKVQQGIMAAGLAIILLLFALGLYFDIGRMVGR